MSHPQPLAYLRVLYADGSLESHALHGGDNIIGRQPLQDGATGTAVTIRSEAVSRQHLCVIVGSDGFTVKDLASANGTLTSDGGRVTKMDTGGSITLRNRSTLFIGDVECTLLLAASDTPSVTASGGGAVTDGDVKRHAEVLGLALPAEEGLLWIAEAALKAALPDNWQRLTDALGRAFYYHATSGRKSIDRPQDSYYRCLLSEIRRKNKCEAALGISLHEQAIPTLTRENDLGMLLFHFILPETNSIGKAAAQVDIVGASQLLSKVHCTFHNSSSCLHLVDHNSTNETVVFAGGEAIALIPGQYFPMADGDIITLGDLEYELHCPPTQLAGSLPSTRLPLDTPPAAGPPYCLAEVPGLVESTSSGGIPEHNGFYASFPFNQQQQSSIHLESFSMQNIMRGAPPTLPCKSMWSFAMRCAAATVVNDTRSDVRFGRDCSFGSVMLVPIYSNDTLNDKDEFGSVVVKQGCDENVVALGIIEIKDNLLPSGFTEMDAVVAENVSKVAAAVLQREDVRTYMRDSDLEGRLMLTGTFVQQMRQAEALIARQSGFDRCFIFLSHNGTLSHQHSDGRTSALDPTAYPFNVCCNRLSVVFHPNARVPANSIDWNAVIARIVTCLHLDATPHSFMVLPLLGGCKDGVESMPFGVAVCLQWAGAQRPISTSVRGRTLSLATSASLVLQTEHANVTEKQRACAQAATVELSWQLRNAAAAELTAKQTAFSSPSNGIVASDIPPPDAVPLQFLQAAHEFTATACRAQLAIVYVASSPLSGGDRLVCVNREGIIEGQPCGRGIVGSVYRSNAPLVINSVLDDRRFVSNIDTPSGIQVQNMIAVPLPCASNSSIPGGVLALFNVEPEVMHVAIGLDAARDAAAAIAHSLTFLITGIASSCVRQRLQTSIASLMSCLHFSLHLHSNTDVSDIVLRSGCAYFEKLIHCDAINAYTMRPGSDVMFPFQLPHNGHSTAPAQVHFPIDGLVGLAARTGSIIASTSPLHDPNYSPSIDRCGPGRAPSSILCIPIMAGPEQSQALRALAVAAGSSYTFGNLARVAADNPDSRMLVDLWLPPLFASSLAPPDFGEMFSNGVEQSGGVLGVVELVLHARKKNQVFKSDDITVAALFASQLSIAVRNSRQLMQIDTVSSYCHPMLSSLLVDSPSGGKEQLNVIESLRRTALGLCRTQFAAIFIRETSIGRDELVSVEWLSAVLGLTLSNLLSTHPRLVKRFAPYLAQRDNERRQRSKEQMDALKAGGLGTDSGSVSSVFKGTAGDLHISSGARGTNGADDDLDVPIRLRVPVSGSHGGLVGTCALRGDIVIMQHKGQHSFFKAGIDDRHSLVTDNEVCAPICDCSGKVIAVLQLINHPGGFFSPEDLQAIKIFTLIASEALKEMEEATLYRQWLTFTRGVRKILQFSAISESGDRESNVWQTCADTLAGMMQCAAYCFVLSRHDERRWTRFKNGAPVVKNAKRSGLPSQCIRCGDLQRQDAISRKYDEQSSSYSKGQGYIDLLSDSDDEAPTSESGVSATAESSAVRPISEAHDGGAAEEAGDSGGPGASSSCGLLCVPLTDVHLGKVIGCFTLERSHGSSRGFSSKEVDIITEFAFAASATVARISPVATPASPLDKTKIHALSGARTAVSKQPS